MSLSAPAPGKIPGSPAVVPGHPTGVPRRPDLDLLRDPPHHRPMAHGGAQLDGHWALDARDRGPRVSRHGCEAAAPTTAGRREAGRTLLDAPWRARHSCRPSPRSFIAESMKGPCQNGGQWVQRCFRGCGRGRAGRRGCGRPVRVENRQAGRDALVNDAPTAAVGDRS